MIADERDMTGRVGRVLSGIVLFGVVGLLLSAVAGAGGEPKFRTSAVSVDALAETGTATATASSTI